MARRESYKDQPRETAEISQLAVFTVGRMEVGEMIQRKK